MAPFHADNVKHRNNRAKKIRRRSEGAALRERAEVIIFDDFMNALMSNACTDWASSVNTVDESR